MAVHRRRDIHPEQGIHADRRKSLVNSLRPDSVLDAFGYMTNLILIDN